ncbi:MAG: co-chaperone GroES [Candidatus Nomurabacteria bacterium]|nr:co-chaperone GroES [Candidatus Saccharibacteria bacterium]USN95831.1 MAG: co-chaperone GroES [Candidatus Nomurabacteria bacterium]
MTNKIQPMEDYVVVQAEETKTTTTSGLYIPDSAQEKPKTAKVVAVGSDVKGVKVGDKIIYKNEYEATTVKFGADEYTVVYKKNIIAIVK